MNFKTVFKEYNDLRTIEFNLLNIINKKIINTSKNFYECKELYNLVIWNINDFNKINDILETNKDIKTIYDSL